MSEPIEFPEANHTLTAPEGREDVKPLLVWKGEDVIISCWKLTWRERWIAFVTGKVWLWVMSQTTQPPVYIGAEYRPFIVEEKPHE